MPLVRALLRDPLVRLTLLVALACLAVRALPLPLALLLFERAGDVRPR